jgi:hypothetical protein
MDAQTDPSERRHMPEKALNQSPYQLYYNAMQTAIVHIMVYHDEIVALIMIYMSTSTNPDHT